MKEEKMRRRSVQVGRMKLEFHWEGLGIPLCQKNRDVKRVLMRGLASRQTLPIVEEPGSHYRGREERSSD